MLGDIEGVVWMILEHIGRYGRGGEDYSGTYSHLHLPNIKSLAMAKGKNNY